MAQGEATHTAFPQELRIEDAGFTPRVLVLFKKLNVTTFGAVTEISITRLRELRIPRVTTAQLRQSLAAYGLFIEGEGKEPSYYTEECKRLLQTYREHPNAKVGQRALGDFTIANRGLAWLKIGQFVRRNPRARRFKEDLFEVALEGIVDAAQNWRPELGFSFSTYASWKIFTRLRACYKEMDIPRHSPSDAHKLEIFFRARNQLMQRDGIASPTLAQVLRKAEISVGEFEAICEASHAMKVSHTSLHGGMKKYGNGVGFPEIFANRIVVEGDSVRVSRGPWYFPLSPESASAEESRLAMAELLSHSGLSEREATALILRYGLGGASPVTLTHMGHQWGISTERARQIVEEALGKLIAHSGRTPFVCVPAHFVGTKRKLTPEEHYVRLIAMRGDGHDSEPATVRHLAPDVYLALKAQGQ